MTQLTTEQRNKIFLLAKQGYSEEAIGRRVGCARSTVRKWKKRPVPASVSPPGPGRGRKRKLSQVFPSKLKSYFLGQSKVGSRRLAPKVAKRFHVNISDRSIRRYVVRAGLKWKRPVKKPFLTDAHRLKRRKFAKKYEGKTDWDNWVFGDEKTFFVKPPTTGERVREHQIPITEVVPHPIKCHCWLVISPKATFRPYLFTENMDAPLYRTILQDNLVRPSQGRLPENWTFAQDRDPKHMASGTQEWLNEHVPNWVQDWPANSPDLNPIENLWSILANDVASRHPTSLQTLKTAIEVACKGIPKGTIKKLFASMDKRLQECLQSDGGHTSY